MTSRNSILDLGKRHKGQKKVNHFVPFYFKITVSKSWLWWTRLQLLAVSFTQVQFHPDLLAISSTWVCLRLAFILWLARHEANYKNKRKLKELLLVPWLESWLESWFKSWLKCRLESQLESWNELRLDSRLQSLLEFRLESRLESKFAFHLESQLESQFAFQIQS